MAEAAIIKTSICLYIKLKYPVPDRTSAIENSNTVQKFIMKSSEVTGRFIIREVTVIKMKNVIMPNRIMYLTGNAEDSNESEAILLRIKKIAANPKANAATR